MTERFSPVTFSLVFCCVYTASFWLNQPLFVYYPLHNKFAWGATVLTEAGPSMAWYGIMANALILAFVMAWVVPNRVFVQSLRNRLWVFPFSAMLICAYILRDFFLQG